jgi:hypothetical protein
MLRKEMYRLDPVIRWDAWHAGTIALQARARHKHIGGLDGVTVSLLRVTDPLRPDGTQRLGQVHLTPDSQAWQEFPGNGMYDVQFEDSLLVLDTVDDAPVDENGTLLDNTEIEWHVEYTKVCPLGQPCRSLERSELRHRDATGQLSYVFDFPGDLRISELPRDRYWQLLPPISESPRLSHLLREHNRISGVVRKTTRTETPVHVRIRCESFESHPRQSCVKSEQSKATNLSGHAFTWRGADRSGLSRAFDLALQTAGLQDSGITPHSFRRAAITT